MKLKDYEVLLGLDGGKFIAKDGIICVTDGDCSKPVAHYYDFNQALMDKVVVILNKELKKESK